MNERKNELLFGLIERYQFHSTFKTNNPITQKFIEKMIALEIDELWMLTQVHN